MNAAIRWVVVCAGAGILFITGCSKPSKVNKETLVNWQENVKGGAVSTDDLTDDELADIQKEYEQTKKSDRKELDRLIRTYSRAKKLWLISEERYYERLHLWALSGMRLELMHMPVSFAGEVPSRDIMSFETFAATSEDLLSGLDGYLELYSGDDATEIAELSKMQLEAEEDVKMENPSSGSILADALAAFKSDHFAEVRNASNTRGLQLGAVVMAKSGIGSGSQLLDFIKLQFASPATSTAAPK